ncbi:MAG: glycosyltransferase family 2 protein, partial [Mucilaginibacter sp.]
TIISSTKNVGFCISNNRMVEYSQGEFLLLLNNDAVLRPGSLNAFFKRANQQNLQGIIGLPQYNLSNKELVDRGYSLDIFMNPVPIIDNNFENIKFVTGACLWLPKELWNKIGGFPSWFESVAEDTYLCCCARLLGYPVEILPEPGFDHWIGHNLGGGKVEDKKLSTSFTRRRLSERNKTFNMLICIPLCPLAIIFPLHLMILTIEGIILSTIKCDFKIWNKIYSGILFSILKHRKELYRQRKLIMSQRKASLKEYFSGTKIIPRKLIMLLKYGLPKIR